MRCADFIRQPALARRGSAGRSDKSCSAHASSTRVDDCTRGWSRISADGSVSQSGIRSAAALGNSRHWRSDHVDASDIARSPADVRIGGRAMAACVDVGRWSPAFAIMTLRLSIVFPVLHLRISRIQLALTIAAPLFPICYSAPPWQSERPPVNHPR